MALNETEFDAIVTADGIVFSLNDLMDKGIIGDISGYGLPPTDYRTQQGPNQNGITVTGYRLDPRTLQFLFRWQGCSREDYWSKRNQLLDILRPNRSTNNTIQLARLRKVYPDNSKRDIYVYPEIDPLREAPRPDEQDIFGFQGAFRLIAPEAVFFDPDTTSTNFAEVGKDEWTFPFQFPNLFNAVGVISTTQVITYTGSWLVYPIITLGGPLNAPEIKNLSTGEEIKLLYNIAAGEVVTVDLRFGRKTVSNNAGANLVGTVSTDSDLATFHIAPDPEVSGGVNNIEVFGTGGTGATRFDLSYNTRYIGL